MGFAGLLYKNSCETSAGALFKLTLEHLELNCNPYRRGHYGLRVGVLFSKSGATRL